MFSTFHVRTHAFYFVVLCTNTFLFIFIFADVYFFVVAALKYVHFKDSRYLPLSLNTMNGIVLLQFCQDLCHICIRTSFVLRLYILYHLKTV